MNVALYVRVSSLDQNTDSQRRELEGYARRHTWNVAAVYEDKASGVDPNRPALARLIADCRAGRIETVLCWKLDRFGRSLLDCLSTLEILERAQVRFLAISQGLEIHQANPASRLLLHVLGAAAQFERELIRERAISGLARYREDLDAGRVGKTVHSRSGKDMAPHRPRIILNMDKIIRLRKEGLKIAVIAARFGASPSTIERRLRRAGAVKSRSQPSPEPAGAAPEAR